MASAWRVAEMGWGVTVLGWFLSPIIGLLLNKLLSYLGFDASQKLRELEIHTIRKLKLTLSEVEEQRIPREARKERDNVKILNELASMLRSALYEAEDILDLIDYHQIEKKVVGDGESHDSSWLQWWLQCLYDAVGTCVACCSRSWLGRCVHINRGRSAALLRWVQQSLCWLGRCVRATLRRSAALLRISHAPSVSSVQRIRCWTFDFRNCCRSIFAWSANAIAVARSYRNWSYEEVGITSYQDDGIPVDSFLPTIARWKLKKRIERLENTVTEVKKSDLLNQERSSALKIIANMNRRGIRSTAARKVFGRDKERNMIINMLREGADDCAPSYNSSECYSAIGIYGIAGSGKTTLTEYVRDYEKEAKDKYFDPIMCIHVSETFRVDDIFRDMLKQITNGRHPDPNMTDCEELKAKLMEELRGRRFLLVLDDLWVKDENYQEREELLSPLNVGRRGSKILVTARTEHAVRALGAKKPIAISDLDEDQYFKLFMHNADMNDPKYEHVGWKIAKKLRRSPIAAVTVAARLRGITNINEWESTAELDQLNETMGALWWSYQQLDSDVRRCFEYCSMFPTRYELGRDELVRMWIAQGFVKTNNATDDMEDVGHSYCHELLSCSFLQLRTRFGSEYYTIHDLLRDLAEKVTGSDCFRIENGWKGEVPRDVRHVFVTTCDRALMAEKILKLENIRTLIIGSGTMNEEIEDEDFESMFTGLRKLRILSVEVRRQSSQFSVPASICQLKHIRYLAIKTSYCLKLILPSTFTKLYHMQVLDFRSCSELVFYPGQDMMSNLINLRHILTLSDLNLPNIIRLTSLQTLPIFRVRKEPGYELRQLRDLNKLRGLLAIDGLENVGSKEEALEVNLAGKVRLTRLDLTWDRNSCSADLEAEILEGLCPPMGLEALRIEGYKGSRYPDWMVGNKNGPKHLQRLKLCDCSRLGAIPGRNEFFVHLRGLKFTCCSWDALPDNMEHLTSLKELLIVFCENIRSLPTLPQSLEHLGISSCENIRSLPTLPQSLEYFKLSFCDGVFMRSCETIGHPNWQKIQHVPKIYIGS